MGQLRKINNNTSGRLRKISDNTQNSNINFVPTGNPTLKQSGNLSQGGGSLLYSESGSGSLFKKKKDNISTLDSVLTTIGDAALESTQATLGLVENLVSDPLTRLTGAVVGIFNKDLSKQIKDYADNDIVGSMFGKSDDLNIGLISKESRKMIDEYSLLGDVGDAVSQGVGTSLGLGAAGSVISGVESGVIGSAATSKGVQAANTFATSGISSYNSKLSEMHKAGYDEHNSQIAALKEGLFEGITENIGAGIPGLNTSGAFEGVEKSLGNAITKSLNKTAGKIAVNVLKAGEESSEEFFNNLFNEVSDRILYQIDKNYTYGKDEKSDSLIKDIFNEQTLEAMVSAGISSALTMGGSNVFDKVSTNKAIKSYAKDNNISFKEARDTINKYKQTISENLQRNGEESIVEANEQASAIALRSAKDGSIAYNENRLKNLLKTTNDTEENIRKDLVSGRYDRYTFKKGTNANENALEMSFRDAGADNSQRTKDLVDLGKSIQNATKNKVKVRATNREQLLQNNNVLNSINKDIRKSQQELIKEEQQEINRINNEYEAQLNSIDSTGMLDETLEASIRLEQQEKIQNIRQEYTRRLSEVKDKIQNEFLNNLNGFMTKDENGNAVLVVNYDSTNTESGKFIIGHELTHTLENVEGYEEYKKLINEYYQKNNSEEYNNHKKQLEKLYANNKGDIEAEMTADLTGKMFSDEKFLTNMLNTKANMFTNIYSKVKELYYKATGQQEKAQLEEIMRNFRNVYAKVKNADIDKEVKLSLSEDNQGRELSKQQQEFFKDSKVRDEKGRLIPMYHGTPTGTTTEFRPGTYFTSNKQYADTYQNPGASSISSADRKVIDNPKTYQVYLDIKNPFDISNPEIRDIFINEYVKGGYALGINPYLSDAEYNKIQTIDWTEGENLQEFLEEEHPEFDGLILNEGGIPLGNGEVLDRGTSYVVMSPEQVKNIDNTNPTSNPDIRYSLSTKDNQGRELTKEQQEFFKDSKAVDENGNLVTVYHTTTNEIAQFNEFNPVGTEGYRFGDQVVNYYTDSKDMSGSYADSEYEMADTKRVENINEAKDLISGYNAENETSFEIVNNSDGTMSIVDNTYANALSRMRELWENEFSPEEKARLKEYGEQMEGYIKSGYDNNLYPDFGSLDKVLPDISKKIDNIESNLKSYERDIFSSIRTNPDGEIPSYIQTEPVYVGTYNNENELLRDVKSALKRANSVRAKYQYEGYVNITNPYIVDAEKRNWKQVIQESNDFIDELEERVPQDVKDNLTRLYQESANKSAEARENYNVLEQVIRQGISGYNSSVDDNIKKVNEVVKRVGFNEVEDALNDGQMGIIGVSGWYNLAESLEQNGLIGSATRTYIIDEFKLPKQVKDLLQENYTKEIPIQQIQTDDIVKIINQVGRKTTLKDLYSKNMQNYIEFDKYRMPNSYFMEQISSEGNDYLGNELNDIFETRAEIYSPEQVGDEISQAASVAFSKPEMIRLWGTSKTTNDVVKEIIASNKDGLTNYDGLIIKNVYDYGGKNRQEKQANNLYITFNSNQFKAVDNENPTNDPDIRYSMSEEQEITPNEDAIRNQIVKEMPELPFVEDTDKGIEKNNITPYTNSKGGILSDEDIKTRANELINEKINRNTLRTNERALEEAKISLNLDKQKVDEFNNSLNQYRGMTSEQLSQSKARDDIYDFVQKNSTMTYKENFEDETLKKAKNELRKTKIKITDELKNSITDYNEFKKSVFGKLTLSNEGQGVDSVYNEFKEMYPSYFEELNTEEDMLYKLKDFMESNTNTINEETYELTPNEIKSFADRIYYALQRGRLSESELNKYVSEINSKMENVYNRRLAINKYREDAKQYTKNLDLIKDKKMGILYQINTAKRNIRDIMPKDMAEEWYNHYIKPVSDNNAKANITHQYYNDRIAKYNLNDEESTYVQMIGEKGHNPQTTLTDNQIIDFYNKNQNKIDKAKCEKAVEEFRSIYDELYNSINQVLRANGYKGLEYRKGYFPHFIEEKSTSFLGKLAEKMGWKKPSGALPTDIAGITEEFKPGKAWTSFAQQRTGDATDYNALKGFDNYLNGAMDVIFHTEDIQKLRALENEIRYQYSDKGVKEKIDSIMNDDSLDIEEKYDQIQSTLSNVRNNPLGNLVSEIREYTNNLANKKSFTDRSMEQLFGRNTYSISKQIMSRVSANMVGANVSSAMTNFIPITQAWGGMSTKNLFKGIQSTIQATFKDDGFSNNSVWLTNRTKQADRLYKSKLDKINEKLGIPFEAVDSFTSNVIVRGKYLDNIEKGMSEQEAISNADEFAKDVMAGRSKGETPTAFNKTNPLLKMFTAFQLEVNNQYGYMFKDLPASAGEAKDKLAAALLKVFLGAFLYNWLSEKITGRKSAFSPIDTAIDNIETATNENLDFGQKLQAITKDVSQELPFVSGIVGGGRLPISSAIPFANRSEYQDSALELMVEAFGENEAKKAKAQKELIKEFSKPIYFLALPFAGGQIKKTIEGAEMYSHELPGSYTTSGNLRFEAPQDALGKAQALVFGQYASENAREYFDKGYSALTPKQVQEAQNADLSINEYREYQKGMKGKTKISDQVDYINSLPYSEEQKESLIKDKTKKDIDVSNYNNYDSYDEFNYAMNNPAKYDIIKQIVDYRTYNTYNDDIKKIKANSNNAKKEVINYIEKLNLNKYQKTMLYRISGGYSIKNYKNEMYNYINSLNITANEKKNIWKELYGG